MKYHGNIGFIRSVDTGHSVYKPQLTEKPYYGDVLRNNRRYDNGQQVNDEVKVNNQISIVADQFAYENIGYMRYITWMGQKWKVDSADIEYPRINITMGGLYNVTGHREESQMGT